MILPLEARKRYYTQAAVRERIWEFFGGPPAEGATAVYFAPGTEWESRHKERLPLPECPHWLEEGAELNRSLWDRRFLIAHLDIEYVNFDFPAHPYLVPRRIFEFQQPVVAAVASMLDAFGICPMHILTGRGHHFTWRIARDSRALRELSALGHMSKSLKQIYSRPSGPGGEPVDADLGTAFAGLGLVIEFLAHQIRKIAASATPLPIALAAIEPGPTGAHGREMIAIDITEYADPLSARVVRTPFSVYLKPWQLLRMEGQVVIDQFPPIFLIPVDKTEMNEAVELRQDVRAVSWLAQDASTVIPDASQGMEALIRAYKTSQLARFHDAYYAERHDAKSRWPETYDRTPMDTLPACVRFILQHPNDLLLRPACVAQVVRTFLAIGWHPRHIAGLIRSKYERDHGWGDQWEGCDPATRADFYARIFAGQVATGGDNLIDFNCQSAREEGLCFVEGCAGNLETFKKSLLNRRHHERLAGRPFNGLFLPEEHL